MTASAPSNSSAHFPNVSPSHLTTRQGAVKGLRLSTTTSCPFLCSARASTVPIFPEPPGIMIFMINLTLRGTYVCMPGQAACNSPTFQRRDSDWSQPDRRASYEPLGGLLFPPAPDSKLHPGPGQKAETHHSSLTPSRSTRRDGPRHRRCRVSYDRSRGGPIDARRSCSATKQNEIDRDGRAAKEIGPRDCRARRHRHREQLDWC